jgi:predicted DNA binding CopG/RHH family protein
MNNPKYNKPRKNTPVSPEEALQFLEDFRQLASAVDEPTTAISLRVPQNILRAVQLKAKADGKKYQSLIIAYIRKGLREG